MIAFYEEMSINNKLFEVRYVKNDTHTHVCFLNSVIYSRHSAYLSVKLS